MTLGRTAAQYGELWRRPGVARVLLPTELARLPASVGSLSLFLYVQHQTRSYAVAATALAVYSGALAVAWSVIGRLIDRRGLWPVVGSLVVAHAVKRYTTPDRFRERIGSRYVRSRAVTVVCLVAPTNGVVDEKGAARLAAAPSAHGGSALALRPGTRVRRTVDLFGSPGHVYLVANDSRDIDRDYQAIRELEADGPYRTCEASAANAD